MLEPTTGRNWLRMLGRFLLASAIGNLASEVVQFPLYTLWHTGTAYEIALMVLHCAAGDVLIAFVAVVAALLAVGSPSWPQQRFAAVMLGTVDTQRQSLSWRCLMDEQANGTAAKPRSYTEDYKRQVVDLVTSTGRTASSVAAEVGLHHTLVSQWIRRYGQANRTAPAAATRPAASALLKPVPVPTADQAAEIARLRRENERLRMERDILKRGIAIFAVPSR